ncbi:MAG: ribosome biogenesis GTPase Der [Mycoplasma sp.]
MNTVAIVGKPNVGKSTLFNRLIGYRKSIVDDEPGVTRDRIYATAEWLTRKFELIDTGGISLKDSTFQENINTQVEFAIEEAQTIIFLTSFKNGTNPDDAYIAKLLKKKAKGKKIILVSNMAERYNHGDDLNQFFNLGFGKPIMLSAEHGINTGDLLDEIIESLPPTPKKENDSLTFCIIGRPNVGKSSLTNALLHKERVIVSDVPGTTRDSIDVDFKYNGEHFTLIDTAGIRRKGKVQEAIEKFAVLRAERAIARSKIILLVLDGSQPFREQDEVIGGLASNANIPTIIVVNKIDLISRTDEELNHLSKIIRAEFKHLSWAPIIFTSAINGKKIHNIFSTIKDIAEQAKKEIQTSVLNEVVLQAQMIQQAPLFKGARINISYVTQVKSQIPTFVIFCSNVNSLHFTYARYIENRIRKAFGFDKVPITLYWKDKNSRTRGVKINE